MGKLYIYEWFSQKKPEIYEPWADYIGVTLITILALVGRCNNLLSVDRSLLLLHCTITHCTAVLYATLY